jgi:hypothetical protein
VFYLPHRAVRKEKRGRTKCRIVFDASSHESDAPSLNDALEMGVKFSARDFSNSAKVHIASLSYRRRHYASVLTTGPG